MNDIKTILKKYWGYDSFRPLQEEIIESVLNGNDTLAIMPTGGGKSLCFQVPSMALDGICLVVSPLIALMKDQVLNLKKKGICALAIHSGMNYSAVKKTLQNAAYGNFKFLYVSPERLETELFLEFLPALNINIIAVDEAHCISQWGYDFRPPYLRIAALREYLPKVPILALTASATREVKKDICERLLFRKGFHAFQQSFERPNLSYSAFQLTSKENKLLTILKNVPGSAIVYCKTRKRTRDVAQLLCLHGITADHYHAGLTSDTRTKKQEEWIANTIRVIVCTNAFGMGIDKPDVRAVIHYDIPDALENYYQEAGRAGRDGKMSYAVLLFNQAELHQLSKQVSVKFPSREKIMEIYGALCNFLQLPAGSGKGKSFDFDINLFSKNFRLDVLLINSVLKILEQEEWLSYSEQFFSPPTVEFTINKKGLNEFEKSQPKYDPVIKALLRSYDGIFDIPCIINPDQVSRMVRISKEQLIQQLEELTAYRIIDFVPQKELPQIYFFENRIRAEDLSVNMANVLKRKSAYEKRLNAMISYATNETNCRSQLVADYFIGDGKVDKCKICDNCRRQSEKRISSEQFTAISKAIKSLSDTSPVSSSELFQTLSSFKKTHIRKVLNFLQAENQVSINEDGLIYYRKS